MCRTRVRIYNVNRLQRSTRTLTADDFYTHARMVVPLDCLKANEASCDWLFEVGVFHSMRLRIAFENLRTSTTLAATNVFDS